MLAVDAPPHFVLEDLASRGVSRRRFLEFCAATAAILALPAKFAPRIAEALEAAEKPTVIWLEFQDCAGDTESFLRAREPSVAEILLDVLAVEYHETIMAAAGFQAEAAKEEAIARGGQIVIVEGSVPIGANGVYCTIGGKTAVQILAEATRGAAAVINVGTCSAYGGLPAAKPNPTSAVGIPDLVSGVPVLNLPGCPMNVDNLVATIVHYLTFSALPAVDGIGRPLFAYGQRIHDHCERRAHFDAGQFVQEWGDDGHRAGWCLYKMGCKGPSTYHNCPSIRWNGGQSWPVAAGHGCVGCSEPEFWDTMTPIYGRLPAPPGFGVTTSLEQIGAGIVGLTAAGFALHGVGKVIQHKRADQDVETPIEIKPTASDGEKGADR